MILIRFDIYEKNATQQKCVVSEPASTNIEIVV